MKKKPERKMSNIVFFHFIKTVSRQGSCRGGFFVCRMTSKNKGNKAYKNNGKTDNEKLKLSFRK
jgi:hypothetical protein